MTEQLLLQQLESPSGTGRDEPRSQISLPKRTNKRSRTSTPILTGSYGAIVRRGVNGLHVA